MEEAGWHSLWSSDWDYSGGGFSLSAQCHCSLLLENIIRNNGLAGFSQTPGQFVKGQHWCICLPVAPGESWGLLPALCHMCQCHPQASAVQRCLRCCSALGLGGWTGRIKNKLSWNESVSGEINSQNLQLAILLDWWITLLQLNFRKGQNP